jgi:molybdopterin/thiamine biosynthesis adenylyltransferase
LTPKAADNSLPRVVVVGIGGLGCPTLWALSTALEAHWVLVDDDIVDEGNLGRQILFADADIGDSKLAAAQRKLQSLGVSAAQIELRAERLLPENAREIVRGASLVIEGADNYATKFLTADACHLERVPVVHGAALGWRATVWSVSAQGAPCYRCLFEDVPSDNAPNCSSAGVIGPVTGFAGALMADAVLDVLSERGRHGKLFSFDGQRDVLRSVSVAARPDCPLCGRAASIFAIDEERYTRQICAA